jgi:hypothetical protein
MRHISGFLFIDNTSDERQFAIHSLEQKGCLNINNLCVLIIGLLYLSNDIIRLGDRLVPDMPSPHVAGATIIWTAKAKDPDNDQILYSFLLNSKPVTDWTTDNRWTWSTTSSDVGENQIEIEVRDGKHADSDSYDSDKVVSFTIAKAEPIPIAAPVYQAPVSSGQEYGNSISRDEKWAAQGTGKYGRGYSQPSEEQDDEQGDELVSGDLA